MGFIAICHHPHLGTIFGNFFQAPKQTQYHKTFFPGVGSSLNGTSIWKNPYKHLKNYLAGAYRDDVMSIHEQKIAIFPTK